MIHVPGKPQRRVKLVSIALTLSIFTTQVLLAHPPPISVWDERRQTAPPTLSQLPGLSKLRIADAIPSQNVKTPFLKSLPLQYGVLQSTHEGSNGTSFLIIQDVHMNLEAQGNVVRMLRQLSDQRKLGLVAVEGAFGRFDFEQFWRVADGRAVKDVADTFFETNRMGAPSYVGITAHQSEVSYIGVDDLPLYQANVDAYKESEKQQVQLRKILAKEKESQDRKKKKVFNAALKKLDDVVSAYQSGEMSLGQYINRLDSRFLENDGLGSFLKAYQLERKLDWARADFERKTVLEKLIFKLGKSEVEELIQTSVAYRAGEVRYGDYYRYLTRLLARHSISLAQSPAFDSYLRYTALADGINSEQLFKEVQRATEKSLAALTQSDEERALLRASRLHYLREKLIQFAMTPDEWNEYQAQSNGSSSFESFYEHAHLRSAKIVENLLKSVAGAPRVGHLSVLVVGGFHTPEITHLLKEKGYGYAVVSPRITKLDPDSGSAYLSIFTREKTPLEKLFAGEKLTIYPAQNNLGSNSTFTNGPNREFIARLKVPGWAIRLITHPTFIYAAAVAWYGFTRDVIGSCLISAIGMVRFVDSDLEPAQLYERLVELASNFDLRFRGPARDILERLSIKLSGAWTREETLEVQSLLAEAERAFDWKNGWAASSKHYPRLKGHPIYLLSMEARISASRTANNEAEHHRFSNRKFDRLTTAQGGLGDLAGGWIAEGLARMGMVTTLQSESEAPEAYAFLPNYRCGVRLSKVDEWGWPISDESLEAWSATRPQDYGIGLIPDPDNPSQPLTIQVSVDGLGLVDVQFRAVHHSGLRVIMIETDANEDPVKQAIFDKLYQGKPSTAERFRQQWVYGLAVEEFKRRMKLPDGPIHMNETATFSIVIARLRTCMERYLEQGVQFDEAYTLAMHEVGNQIIFFTHTLEEAGIDKFYDHSMRMGDYIRVYFEQLEEKKNNRGEALLRQGGAGDVASWMIQGKPSSLHHKQLPGFRIVTPQDVFLSPLNFLVNLAYLVREDDPSSKTVNVVAVSRYNANEAGKFFSSREVPILEKYQVDQRPVQALTNAVGELYFSDPRIIKALDLEQADPSARHPERILNPSDPQAHDIHRLVTERELPSDYTSPAISDDDLGRIFDENREKLIWRVRWAVKGQYIRNIQTLSQLLTRGDLPASHHKDAVERLDILKKRWELWTGRSFPASIEDMAKQPLNGLFDAAALTATWARRVVEYKRMLFVVFGERFDAVEKKISQKVLENEKYGRPIVLSEILSEVMQEGGYSNLKEMCGEFINLIQNENTQFLFAGPTFESKGRTQVAMLDYVLQQLSSDYPEIQKRAVYVEGYNDELSPYLLQGSDVWLNNPKRPREASGTSGQKNEGTDVSTADGWVADSGFDGLNVLLIQPKNAVHKDHPDFWPEQMKNRRDRQKYLQDEAASLYEALSKVARMHKFDRVAELNLRRRAIYYKLNVFSVRSAFAGRHIPSSDPDIAKSGPEIGMFELYDRVIDEMDKSAVHARKLEKTVAMRDGVKYFTPHLQLQLVPGSPKEVQVAIDVQVPHEIYSHLEFFVGWGIRGDGSWSFSAVEPLEITSKGALDTYTLCKNITVDQAGSYGVTVFAVVKGLGGNDSLNNRRLYASRSFGDDAEFTANDSLDVLLKEKNVPGASARAALSVLTPDEIELANKIKTLRASGDAAGLARELTGMIKLNNLGIGDYSPVHAFLSHVTRENHRNFYKAALAAMVKRGDQFVLVPESKTEDALVDEIESAGKVTWAENKLIVILNADNVGLLNDPRFKNRQSSKLEFVLESELGTPQGIEEKILWPARNAGKTLKFLLHTDGLEPDNIWMRAMFDLSSLPEYKELAIQFILINSFKPEDHAIRATVEDMKALMVFLAQA